MAYERIDASPQFDGMERDSHEMRYRIARQFVLPGDSVLDACCGEGYGYGILTDKRESVMWTGIDRNPPHPGVMEVDFEAKNYASQIALKVPATVDVFVGLECIEHLNDEGVERFVALAKQARKWIIVSTPIVRNSNPYHVQQFTMKDIHELFFDAEWRLQHYLEQDSKYGIFIFKRI